ncbi:hypothetical protein [Winogradskyella sp. R77965]|uniref:hypothetical protein n=1 Tax=Winogradskyella sp. R77965 TaxID=3093872 RepID=UPI0037DC2C4B
MKNSIFLIAVLLLFYGCSNNDDSTNQSLEENPIEKTIEIANLDFDETIGDNTSPIAQYGYTFSSNSNGKITKLGLLLKIIATNGRIQIWDFDTQTLIFDELVNTSFTGVASQTITPISIIANKKYVITVVTRMYQTYLNNSLTPIYPIQADSITLIESRADTNFMSFPTIGNPNAAALAGIPTFAFEPDN